MSDVTAMRCAGCGHAVIADTHVPFRCPAAASDDDIDHVLVPPPSPPSVVASDHANPFLRYRHRLHAYGVARAGGMTDAAFVALVEALDERVAAVDGHGFLVTPYGEQPALARAVGVTGGLWVKNETGNVSGSHKARHLMGIAVYLEVAEAIGIASGKGAPLAIASCGNAALAAAVVARAADRPLRVFVPTSANPRVVARLEELGAAVVSCERRASDPPGDPCYLRFLEAVADGALPFACQGNQNGLTIDGGMTLGYELVDQHVANGGPVIDHVAIQVGGGAVASATIQALRWARDAGLVDRLPAVHAVQTESAHPVVDAWRRVADECQGRLEAAGIPSPGETTDAGRARWLAPHAGSAAVVSALEHAAHHRSAFMRAIEHEPHSIASGILDDETYDWHQVVRGMIETGGWPVVVDEHTLAEARDLGREHTGIAVSATGASGLAGLLCLVEAGLIAPSDTAAVLFTGVQR